MAEEDFQDFAVRQTHGRQLREGIVRGTGGYGGGVSQAFRERVQTEKEGMNTFRKDLDERKLAIDESLKETQKTSALARAAEINFNLAQKRLAENEKLTEMEEATLMLEEISKVDWQGGNTPNVLIDMDARYKFGRNHPVVVKAKAATLAQHDDFNKSHRVNAVTAAETTAAANAETKAAELNLKPTDITARAGGVTTKYEAAKEAAPVDPGKRAAQVAAQIGGQITALSSQNTANEKFIDGIEKKKPAWLNTTGFFTDDKGVRRFGMEKTWGTQPKATPRDEAEYDQYNKAVLARGANATKLSELNTNRDAAVNEAANPTAIIPNGKPPPDAPAGDTLGPVTIPWTGGGAAPAVAPATAQAAPKKLYVSDGKQIQFGSGANLGPSVQQAVNDGLITPEQARETLLKAGFKPKAK